MYSWKYPEKSWRNLSTRKILLVLFFYIYVLIWLYWVLVVTCRIFSCGMWDLVPWPGIEPCPLALRVWSLSHWATREVPHCTANHFLPSCVLPTWETPISGGSPHFKGKEKAFWSQESLKILGSRPQRIWGQRISGSQLLGWVGLGAFCSHTSVALPISLWETLFSEPRVY